MMLDTCTLAVLSLMNRASAICRLVRPEATSPSTSRSRGVRPNSARTAARTRGGGGRRVGEIDAGAAGQRADLLGEQAGAQVARDRPGLVDHLRHGLAGGARGQQHLAVPSPRVPRLVPAVEPLPGGHRLGPALGPARALHPGPALPGPGGGARRDRWRHALDRAGRGRCGGRRRVRRCPSGPTPARRSRPPRSARPGTFDDQTAVVAVIEHRHPVRGRRTGLVQASLPNS